MLAGTEKGLLYYAETADPALETRHVKVAAGAFGVEMTRAESVMQLRATPAVAGSGLLAAADTHSRTSVIAALRASGIADDAELHGMLMAAGAAPAALNSLYSTVTFQIEPTAGFNASNLSAPIQPQKPDQGVTTGTYRVFAPLYNLAIANAGSPNSQPLRQHRPAVHIVVLRQRCVRQPVADASSYSDTNFYFDPIVPLDQWPGIVPTYDFCRNRRRQAERRLHLPDAEHGGVRRHVGGPEGRGPRQFPARSVIR